MPATSLEERVTALEKAYDRLQEELRERRETVREAPQTCAPDMLDVANFAINFVPSAPPLTLYMSFNAKVVFGEAPPPSLTLSDDELDSVKNLVELMEEYDGDLTGLV